jgi:hypothetical protein
MTTNDVFSALIRGKGPIQAANKLQRSVGKDVEAKQLIELLCQALETEMGGIQIYEQAIRAAHTKALRNEWSKYLDETRNHERILLRVFDELGLDPNTETIGRRVVRANGEALVHAIENAASALDGKGAEVVAAECVVLAETKDHMNWELTAKCPSISRATPGPSYAPPTRKSRIKRTNTSTTPADGRASFGSNRWGSPLFYRRRKRSGTSRPKSQPPKQRTPDPRCSRGAPRAQPKPARAAKLRPVGKADGPPTSPRRWCVLSRRAARFLDGMDEPRILPSVRGSSLQDIEHRTPESNSWSTSEGPRAQIRPRRGRPSGRPTRKRPSNGPKNTRAHVRSRGPRYPRLKVRTSINHRVLDSRVGRGSGKSANRIQPSFP